MNTNVALVLFGLLALSSATYMRNRGYASTEVSEPEHEVKVVSSPTYAAVKSVDDYAYSSRGSHSSSSSGTTRLENERIAEDQNKNAKYNFALAFDDGIMDSSQVRQESRDGLKVVGSYSYSDGYVKRTVKYEADENGYRVLSTDEEPIGNGPQVDLLNGKADVHTQFEGIDTQYSITAHDIAPKEKETKVRA